MIYLSSFIFPDEDIEVDFIIKQKRTCYDSFYPFKILSKNRFERIDFEPITILYGGNGSGKSTALNVIAEKTQVDRDSIYNKSDFYLDYVDICEMYIEDKIPENSRIITSDDVFDYMLNIRNINQGVDQKREELFKEYLEIKGSSFQMSSLEDYDELKRVNNVKSKTQSKFVRENLMNNVRGYSNGENAFRYFNEYIENKINRQLKESNQKNYEEKLILENRMSNIISMLCIENNIDKKAEYEKEYELILTKLKMFNDKI